MTILYSSQEGLDLLIDRAAILVEDKCLPAIHGCTKRRIWRKVHIAVDELALEIRAIEVTCSVIIGVSITPNFLS